MQQPISITGKGTGNASLQTIDEVLNETAESALPLRLWVTFDGRRHNLLL